MSWLPVQRTSVVALLLALALATLTCCTPADAPDSSVALYSDEGGELFVLVRLCPGSQFETLRFYEKDPQAGKGFYLLRGPASHEADVPLDDPRAAEFDMAGGEEFDGVPTEGVVIEAVGKVGDGLMSMGFGWFSAAPPPGEVWYSVSKTEHATTTYSQYVRDRAEGCAAFDEMPVIPWLS